MRSPCAPYFPAGRTASDRASRWCCARSLASLLSSGVRDPPAPAPPADDAKPTRSFTTQEPPRPQHRQEARRRRRDLGAAGAGAAPGRAARGTICARPSDSLDDLKDAGARAAEQRDRQMQVRLEQAIVRLAGRPCGPLPGHPGRRAGQRADLASYAVSSYQTGGLSVLNLGVAFDAETPQEALDSDAGRGHRARQADGGAAAVRGDQGAAAAHRAAGRGHQGGRRRQAAARRPRTCRRSIDLEEQAGRGQGGGRPSGSGTAVQREQVEIADAKRSERKRLEQDAERSATGSRSGCEDRRAPGREARHYLARHRASPPDVQTAAASSATR